MREIYKIDHKALESEFLEHIKGDSKRILFSGPFGTGKSTFLKEFFQKNEEFICLSVYPINYAVASNEDVFELIKFDLLIEIVGKYSKLIKFEKEDFTVLLSSQVFMMQRMKFLPIVSAIIGLSEKVGKPAIELLKALDSTISDFNKFKKDLEIDEKKLLHDYLEEAENKKGSSYEMDDISRLIFMLIATIKKSLNEVKSSQSVLVIDDLDRLDPEHIFRLFNVFSAHYDTVTEKNKFGFDKVVFVCDINNVRKIFHHRYGQDVDFSGYIDKFYSQNVFHFDNRLFFF